MLKKLQTLNLAHNLMKQLPTYIFKIPQLTDLNLAHNKIKEFCNEKHELTEHIPNNYKL